MSDRYRTGDWDTSIEAGELADPRGACRAAVSLAHQDHPEGLTDEELYDIVWDRQRAQGASVLWPDGSIRKRRTDLKADGIVIATTERRQSAHGRDMVVWRYVPDPATRVEVPFERRHDEEPRCDFDCIYCHTEVKA